MGDTQLRNDDTVPQEEDNTDENIAIQHGPANGEVTLITDE